MMSETEYNLSHIYIKDDDANPGSIQLETAGKFVRTENIVINIPGRFQRISVYENGLVVSEEQLPGEHVFRFNKPYTETVPGVLLFA